MKEFVTKDTRKITKGKKEKPVEEEVKEEEAPKKVKLTKKQRIEERRKNKIGKLKESKTEVEQHLTAAQSSTKSVGRFDRKAHDEEREHKVKRRKEYSNFASINDELTRNQEIFDIVRKQGLKKLQHSLWTVIYPTLSLDSHLSIQLLLMVLTDSTEVINIWTLISHEGTGYSPGSCPDCCSWSTSSGHDCYDFEEPSGGG